jgi:methionine--tRNA ligase beta chain
VTFAEVLPSRDKKMVTFGEFLKIDLCIGKLVSAEKIPDKQKVLKVVVDIGSGLREIVVGAAEFYSPDELVGKIVVVCTNLEPRTIGNVTSNGMLLAAEGENGKPLFLTIDGEAAVGATIR